jgi:lipopolysaccharide/colanic/teichoic acid biosynthesis glycosyltransferase
MAIIGPRPERPFRKRNYGAHASMTLDMLLSLDWLGTGELCLWCKYR